MSQLGDVEKISTCNWPTLTFPSIGVCCRNKNEGWGISCRQFHRLQNYKLVWHMFPRGRVRTPGCLTYLISFENPANLSFFFSFLPTSFFLGRTNEFKTLSMTSLFKAHQTSPPHWPLDSSEPHSSAMWCRLSLTLGGFSPPLPPLPLTFQMLQDDLSRPNDLENKFCMWNSWPDRLF